MLTLEENRSLYRRLPDTFGVFIALVPGGSETGKIQPALPGQWAVGGLAASGHSSGRIPVVEYRLDAGRSAREGHHAPGALTDLDFLQHGLGSEVDHDDLVRRSVGGKQARLREMGKLLPQAGRLD